MTRPLLAYYGDDFTGSADVMEVLQWSGLRTVLFLDPPTTKQLEAFDGLLAFGVAGWSRTMSREEMDADLQPMFRKLRESQASFVHYKTCSTFDSSPQIGSIGKAIELGRDVFGPSAVPVVIGAPNLGRYQAFGNLFARSGLDTEPYRLDRHPTMRQHPITPMTEADVRLLLAEQSDLSVGLFDVLRIDDMQSGQNLAAIGLPEDQVVLFDVLYPVHMPRIGSVLDALSQQNSPKFVVGSSGIEYALTQFWSANGQLESMRTREAGHPTFAATDQLVAITGSCSPVNDRQIAWAERNGFEALRIETARLVDPDAGEDEIAATVGRALERIEAGANVILHSSRGPNDPRIAQTNEALQARGMSAHDIKLRSGRVLGPQLGKILAGILAARPMVRVGVAGGDTSGYIARELGIVALEAIAPVAPGSPLCVAYAENAMDGVEFFFKGGQVGKDDVWGTMLSGTA